jgi:acyl-CoA hydrolase
MKSFARRWVKPENLNSNLTLFGGTLLEWLDEESAIHARMELGGLMNIVTKYMSEINFVSPARNGDIIEIELETKAYGRSSITITCEVRNIITSQVIITIDKIVFVCVDKDGKPHPHGKTMPSK